MDEVQSVGGDGVGEDTGTKRDAALGGSLWQDQGESLADFVRQFTGEQEAHDAVLDENVPEQDEGLDVLGDLEEGDMGELALADPKTTQVLKGVDAWGEDVVAGEPRAQEEMLVAVREEMARGQEETLDAVRQEIAQAYDEIAHKVRTELAREEGERQRVTLDAVHDVAEDLDAARTEAMRLEVEALAQEELRILQDADRPLRERMEEVDYVRARLANAESEIAQLEERAAQRATEAERTLNGLEARGTIGELRQDLDRLQERMAAALARPAQEKTQGALPRNRRAGTLWVAIVGLLLLAAVGVVGVLLPRQMPVLNSDATLLVHIAALYEDAGEDELAVGLLDEAVEAGIADVEVLGRVGGLYRELGEYERAIGVLKQAVKESPRDVELGRALAANYSSLARYDEAIAEHQRMIDLDPSDPWRYARLGHLYVRIEEYDKALAQYEKMREADPQEWWAHHYQGGVYLAMGQYDEAIEKYQAAIELYPEYYWTRLYFGQCFAGKNDFARAEEQYRFAIELDPKEQEAYYYLGEALLAQGAPDDALVAYQQAIELEPEWGVARAGLGKAYLNLGDCDSARTQFSLALALDEDNVEAQEGLAACP